MLISISIRNYALITSLDVEFRSGLNMITGETGAGKSILLGALSLLLGSRADTQVLKNKDSKCMVEGTFDLIGPDLKDVFESNDLDFETPAILRREITPQGKSRAFINDTPVNLMILRTIGGMLVDIHSQHQNLMINDPVYALHVVDQFGKLQEKLAAYTTCFDGYRQLNLAVSRLEEQLRKAKADQDYLEFQLAQLDEAGLKEGEQESLEKEQLILENAGEIQLQLMQGIHLLNESEEPVLASIKKIMKFICFALDMAYCDD